jgi:hypothetical protein
MVVVVVVADMGGVWVPAGAPVDQQAGAERDGDTPLLLALRAANLQLAQLLLQHAKQASGGGWCDQGPARYCGGGGGG